jgi:hypothetical protein
VITFEDVWEHGLPSPEQRRATLPTIDNARGGNRQVLVPSAGERDAPPAAIDTLATRPEIESVIAEWSCASAVDLPAIRMLLSLHTARTRRDLLDRLPNLEQLLARDVTPDDLTGLAHLRAAIFDWSSYDVPAGVNVARLLDHPHERTPYRRQTAGAAALARLTQLERLRISRFHHRDSADPIAELANLRWLSLHGWRNLRVIGRLVNLERLELIEFEMTNLRAFRGLTKLRRLHLMGRLSALDGIEALTSLEEIWLRGGVVRDLAVLAELPHLRQLELVYPDAVSDFSPLGGLHGLRRLDITLGDNTDAGGLPTIAFLGGLTELEELALRNVNLLDRRLDPLYELPQLRRVTLTGRAGPNADELRRRRPELELKTHLVGEPEGRVYVGSVHYDPPAAGIEQWSIFQGLADLLGTGTNQAAENRIRAELRRADAELLRRLEFDSEAGAVGIYAASEADIRRVAEVIEAIARGS